MRTHLPVWSSPFPFTLLTHTEIELTNSHFPFYYDAMFSYLAGNAADFHICIFSGVKQGFSFVWLRVDIPGQWSPINRTDYLRKNMLTKLQNIIDIIHVDAFQKA